MFSKAIDIFAVIGVAFSVALAASSAIQVANQEAYTAARDKPTALRCVPKQPSDLTRSSLQPQRPLPCRV